MSEHESHDQPERSATLEDDRALRPVARDDDRALRALNADEIKTRLLEAFDKFVTLGYESHLVGVAQRDNLQYSLRLEPDGAGDVHIREITVIADACRLDLVVEKLINGSGFALVLYPRW